MEKKVIISPSNRKAVEFIKSIKDKKAQIQKHFAQSGKLTSFKVNFTTKDK